MLRYISGIQYNIMAESDLKSPPRPRRLMDLTPQVRRDSARGSKITTEHEADDQRLMQFEDGLVDHAISDLPNIASQVLSLNKDQNKEIQKLQTLLAALQEKVKEGEEKISEVDLEIKCVMNKIIMKEEETKDTNKRIKDIDADIKSLITRICDKEQDVLWTKEKADQEIRKLETKLRKVESYTEKVEKFEQTTSEVYNELQKIKQEIEELRKRKLILDKDPEETERIVSGVIEKELLSEIEDLKSKLLKAGGEAKVNITKLTEERQKHKQLNQTVQVLHKRNTAQLTRLKRQVKESQTRNRQKQTQLSQLQANMAQAEKQLRQ